MSDKDSQIAQLNLRVRELEFMVSMSKNLQSKKDAEIQELKLRSSCSTCKHFDVSHNRMCRYCRAMRKE